MGFSVDFFEESEFIELLGDNVGVFRVEVVVLFFEVDDVELFGRLREFVGFVVLSIFLDRFFKSLLELVLFLFFVEILGYVVVIDDILVFLELFFLFFNKDCKFII